MIRCVLVFSFLGPLALIGGCSSGQSGDSNSKATPAASATQPTAPTKQVTLSVSGMT
jgi:hypothetical protein